MPGRSRGPRVLCGAPTRRKIGRLEVDDVCGQTAHRDVPGLGPRCRAHDPQVKADKRAARRAELDQGDAIATASLARLLAIRKAQDDVLAAARAFVRAGSTAALKSLALVVRRLEQEEERGWQEKHPSTRSKRSGR